MNGMWSRALGAMVATLIGAGACAQQPPIIINVIYPSKLYEVQKYLTVSDHGYAVVVNAKSGPRSRRTSAPRSKAR